MHYKKIWVTLAFVCSIAFADKPTDATKAFVESWKTDHITRVLALAEAFNQGTLNKIDEIGEITDVEIRGIGPKEHGYLFTIGDGSKQKKLDVTIIGDSGKLRAFVRWK